MHILVSKHKKNDIITNDFPTTNILNKYIKYINLGDPIAVLGFIDSVLGSVDLWRGNFGLIMGNLGFDSYCDHYKGSLLGSINYVRMM